MVRVYDGRFLRSLDLRAMDTEINTEILYKAQILHARIVEIPAHLDWSFAEHGRHPAGGHELPRLPQHALVALLLLPVPAVPLLHAPRPHPAGARRVLLRLVRLARRPGLGEPSEFGNSGLTGAIQNAYARAPHAFLFTGITHRARRSS